MEKWRVDLGDVGSKYDQNILYEVLKKITL